MSRACSASLSALLAAGLLSMPCAAQPLRAPDNLLGQVGIDQQLGTMIPLDTTLRDSSGNPVSLRTLLRGKPAVLVPTYYHCENLCEAIRAGIAQSIAAGSLRPGADFQVLLVSFDARESAADARQAQRLDAQAHPSGSVAQWRYLTGADSGSLAALMRGIGFRYRFDTRDGQFAHAAGAAILSPDGKVTQYLFGVQFDAQALRLSLVNAAQGRIGNLLDQFLLFCCRYDESTGRYNVTVDRLLIVSGVGTALLLATLVALLLRGERRRKAMVGAAP